MVIVVETVEVVENLLEPLHFASLTPGLFHRHLKAVVDFELQIKYR